MFNDIPLFFPIVTEIPFKEADMGRKEAEFDWKKTTDNIQEVFDFMEVLGS